MFRQGHLFGGDWTEEKLQRVAKYLNAYMTLMRDKGLKCAYIDAFAGTGTRLPSSRLTQTEAPLFPELTQPEPMGLKDGSARYALQIRFPFDKYIFVEKGEQRAQDLEKLQVDFPKLADRIEIRVEDCNDYLQELSKRSWRRHRAVLFLDPYGMQVSWETMTAVATTGAIDVWVLFPLGVAVNRLLKRSGQILETHRRRLTQMFGTEEWQQRFYQRDAQTYMLEEKERMVKVADLTAIADYYNERLGGLFPRVADNPLRLVNSCNNPLYMLCFACSNPKPEVNELAVKIAQDILSD